MSSHRVLYIVPSWFTLHYRLEGHLAFLRRKGFDILVVGEPDPRAELAAAREGVEYRAVSLSRGGDVHENYVAFRALVRLMRDFQPQIINCTTKKGGLYGVYAARLAGVGRVCYWVRGLSQAPVGRFRRALFDIVERLICASASRVVVISRSNRDEFVRRGLCRESKLVILGHGSSNGVDTDRFSPATQREQSRALRASLGIPPEASVVGFVGRLARRKGVVELADAWEALSGNGRDLRLLLVTPPEIEKGLEGVVERLRANPRVHSTGFLDDPAPAYAAMDCLVLPSYEEGFSNVLLEAAATAVPVVATMVPGCVDAVLHEKTGLLVEARSATALREGIERVLASPETAAAWGRSARERCVALFRPEVIWEAFASLYVEMAESLEAGRDPTR